VSGWEDEDDEAWDDDAADAGHVDSEEDEPTLPCPFCRREIHEEAEQCPYCEQYISDEDRRQATKSWRIAAIALVCVALLLLSLAF
jgi:hypothetical protein